MHVSVSRQFCGQSRAWTYLVRGAVARALQIRHLFDPSEQTTCGELFLENEHWFSSFQLRSLSLIAYPPWLVGYLWAQVCRGIVRNLRASYPRGGRRRQNVAKSRRFQLNQPS